MTNYHLCIIILVNKRCFNTLYWIKLTLSCKEVRIMIGTRHEEYGFLTESVPFIFNTDLKRNRFNRSRENNWHDNLEIQICTEGSGTVLLDGKTFPFHKNDIVVLLLLHGNYCRQTCDTEARFATSLFC